MFSFLNRFQNRLLVLLSTGIFIPTVIITLYGTNNSKKTLVNIVSHQMSIESNKGVNMLNVILSNRQADVLFLSKNPPIQGIVRARENQGVDPLDQSTYQDWEKRLEIIFTSFIVNRPLYLEISYLDENGNELIKVNQNNGTPKIVSDSELNNEKNTDYFQETSRLKNNELYVSPIQLDREQGVIITPYIPILRYATPVYSQQGKLRGMIVIKLDANNLLGNVDSNLKNSTDKTNNQTASRELFVINQDGYYLFYPKDSQKTFGFETNQNNLNLKNDDPEIAKTILSNQEGIIENNQQYVISYSQVSPLESGHQILDKKKFYLVYRIAKRDLFKPLNNLQLSSFLIGFFCITAILILGVLILRNLMQSVSSTTHTIRKFYHQVIKTIEEQEKSIQQQSASVQETTTTMDELNISAQNSAQQAEATAEGAKIALSRVEEGKMAVQTSLHEMSVLQEKVERIATQISQLKGRAVQINSVSNLVSDLANQTNMLALNSAVEAVRAGEQGKGFSVVATEIRKLADESRKSAQQISQLVAEIQQELNSVVTSSEEGKVHVEMGSKLAQTNTHIFADINQTIAQIVANNETIALTAKQQAMATQQVTMAMNTLTEATESSSQVVRQTKQETQQLNQAIIELQEKL